MIKIDISIFYTELGLFLILIIYILISQYGKFYNIYISKRWFERFYPILNTQFAQIGIKKYDKTPLHFKNPSHFTLYATGRIYIDSAYFEIKLIKRQNILLLLWKILITFFTDDLIPRDRLYVNMIVADNVFDECVFAIVNRSILRWLHEKYYHLSFTKIQETTQLPKTYAVMSECSEITHILLEDHHSFIQSIEISNGVLEYFIVSDQPAQQPKIPDETCRKTISFCIQLPHLNYADQVVSIIVQCITFVDLLANKAHWRSNISQKLRASREEVNRKLRKLQNEEQLTKMSKKKAEKDREEKNRVRNMSPQEQRKYLDKERERKYKRQIKTIKV
ncbi:hypothetical protein PCK1_002501 [Pneumocystis canis]|nr:hypothetical protein PCK1_002501 [Pneumocystis canis]